MSDYTTVHETVIRDVLDLISDAKDSELFDLYARARANNYKSLSSKTDGLTLVFPIITSSNADINTATMVAKAQERQAVSMLQILFSAVNINTERDVFAFLRKYHTNLGNGHISVDDFINAVYDMVAEQVISFDLPVAEVDKIKNDLRNLDFHLESNYSESSFNDYRIKRRRSNVDVYVENSSVRLASKQRKYLDKLAKDKNELVREVAQIRERD